jgi:hypothetical protein
MPCWASFAGEAELLMLAVVPDRENAHEIGGYDSEQHRVREAVNEAAANVVFNDAVLLWVLSDPLDGAIDFDFQCFAQATRIEL